MKNKLGIIVLSFGITFMSCSKEEAPQPGQKTAFDASEYGELFIYRMDLCSDGATNISVDGKSFGSFSYVYNAEKNCFEHDEPRAGQIIYRKEGTYLVTAQTEGGANVWAQNVKVNKGQCRYLGLRCGGVVVGDAIYTPTGELTIWVEQATCGNTSPVYVEITGTNYFNSATINPTFESNVDCQNLLDTGFGLEVPIGYYTGTAYETTGNQRVWNTFDFTVVENDCFTFRLYCQ